MMDATESAATKVADSLRGHKAFLRSIGLTAIGVLVGAGFLILLGVLGVYDLSYAIAVLPALYQGFTTTLGLVAIIIPLGFVLGFILGNARVSRSWLIRAASTTYVEFFRGMPPTVLIWFTFAITIVVVDEIPFLRARILDPLSLGILMSTIALAAHSSSYQAEIVRAGILSVPAGQREAGEAIGLTKGSILAHVTLPQMFRVSLPALGNEFASVIKDTSIISIVGALDLTFQGQNLVSALLSGGSSTKVNLDIIFVVWVEIAILYFVMTFAVTRILQYIERRYRVPGLEAAQL